MRSTQAFAPNTDAVSDDQVCIVREREGLQLDRRRNLCQLAAVVAGIVTGAVIGWIVTEDRPEIGALAGGILGMIAGTFLSGLVLMFVPAPASILTVGQLRAKYCRLRRRYLVAALLFGAMVLSTPFVIWWFGNDDSTGSLLLSFLWVTAWPGLCAYSKGLGFRIQEWKCPACGEPFRQFRWSCPHCGLSMRAESQHCD